MGPKAESVFSPGGITAEGGADLMETGVMIGIAGAAGPRGIPNPTRLRGREVQNRMILKRLFMGRLRLKSDILAEQYILLRFFFIIICME